jgi:hypothetical protein
MYRPIPPVALSRDECLAHIYSILSRLVTSKAPNRHHHSSMGPCAG